MPKGAGLAPESFSNASMRNSNKHARSQKLDSSALGVLTDSTTAFKGQFRFECSRFFVESGVDDSAVQSRCFFGGALVFLDYGYRQPALSQFSGDSAADDARTYDANVAHSSGKSVKIPSIPRAFSLNISAGSLTVHAWTRSFASCACVISASVTMSHRG